MPSEDRFPFSDGIFISPAHLFVKIAAILQKRGGSHANRHYRLRYGQPAFRIEIRPDGGAACRKKYQNLFKRRPRPRVPRRQSHFSRAGRDARLYGGTDARRLGRGSQRCLKKTNRFSESASVRNFYSTTAKKETPTAWAGSAAKSDALPATSATRRDAV